MSVHLARGITLYNFFYYATFTVKNNARAHFTRCYLPAPFTTVSIFFYSSFLTVKCWVELGGSLSEWL